jgi:hypothetical protein
MEFLAEPLLAYQLLTSQQCWILSTSDRIFILASPRFPRDFFFFFFFFFLMKLSLAVQAAPGPVVTTVQLDLVFNDDTKMVTLPFTLPLSSLFPLSNCHTINSL